MTTPSLKSIIEAILFASETPLNAGDLLKIIKGVKAESETEVAAEAGEAPSAALTESSDLSPEDQLEKAQKAQEEILARSDVQRVIDELCADYEMNADRGFVLINVAQGFQFRTRQELSPYIKAMNKVSPTRLSQAALETLAIVAYRQPIIRAEVDQIRGVDSGGTLKTLLDRQLVKIVGKKDEPGKPILYGSTESFLEIFNLRSLQDLPTLKDLNQIEEEMRREQGAMAEATPLDSDFFEEEDSGDDPIALRFGELEKEEEEAFHELEEEIRDLKSLEEKVLNTLNPPKPEGEAPAAPGGDPSDPSPSG